MRERSISNHNSADALFSSLRVWQDSNQDAVSQASELHTLAELGIASISATGIPGVLGLGQGNLQVMSGSFTRTNGSTGTAGVAELTGSLLLASNGFYRQFTDDPAITAAAQMQGSEWVWRTQSGVCIRQS